MENYQCTPSRGTAAVPRVLCRRRHCWPQAASVSFSFVSEVPSKERARERAKATFKQVRSQEVECPSSIAPRKSTVVGHRNEARLKSRLADTSFGHFGVLAEL